jgi:hypothetical protein
VPTLVFLQPFIPRECRGDGIAEQESRAVLKDDLIGLHVAHSDPDFRTSESVPMQEPSQVWRFAPRVDDHLDLAGDVDEGEAAPPDRNTHQALGFVGAEEKSLTGPFEDLMVGVFEEPGCGVVYLPVVARLPVEEEGEDHEVFSSSHQSVPLRKPPYLHKQVGRHHRGKQPLSLS